MLEYDYLCQECLRQGYYQQANVVDHIIELKDDWSKRLDKDNLIPLCHSCHNKKTKEEQRRRGTS
nr:HNH endonuclease signature motif containing protein [Mammaliicoccus sp. A-M4]